ncbi:MAG: DUF3500 domain-containing protein [Gammaproteobacteria bacterium]|nr:DUF3500 domain-containing protein [Gammaproteobacteria bacterium]MDP2349435.1 DUF3500 domain-containing protein [Gammaproteobacteria bacterium]
MLKNHVYRLLRAIPFVLALAIVLVTRLPSAQEAPMELTAEMIAATGSFLDSLNAEQRARAVFDFDAEERLNWHFIPRSRQGVSLKELDAVQLPQATSLLRTFLSPMGYEKTEQVRSLEVVLLEIEVNGRFVRDPYLYYLTVFGAPSLEGEWALRFEGHHLAFNWTFAGGMGLTSTPQFVGSNPAEVRSGALTGLRVLAAEEDLARALLKSLSAEQSAVAILPGEAPGDIITGSNREVTALEDVGIAYPQLTAQQQTQLMRIIEQIAAVQPAEIVAERMAGIRAEGVENLKFAWMGGGELGDPHYYRIQGPGFLIEYDNTQNDANHIHLVWRDFEGDFGRDLLRLHYDAVAQAGQGHSH